MDQHVGGPRVARWERRTEWPLAVLAVVFLVVFAWDVLDTNLAAPGRAVLRVLDYSIWAVFAVDYLVRLALARERPRYFLRHLHDVAIIALPVLRPLRLLRLLVALKLLNRRIADSLRGRVAVYVVSTALILVFCAALAVLDAERGHPQANIRHFGDAIWWAAATVCTVGYGDRYPVTGEGRAVATGLMVGGLALIGVITASFATWLIDRVRQVEAGAEAATRRDLHALHAQLDRIERRLAALDGDPRAAQPRAERDQAVVELRARSAPESASS